MGQGAEILIQPATGCTPTNNTVVKNHYNKHSHKKNVNNKSTYFHDEIKKSIANAAAATPNDREGKKNAKAPPSARKVNDTAKTAKSNLTSSYPPYNAKSKPIPVAVNNINKSTPKGHQASSKQNGLARSSPMRGLGTPAPFTRPTSLTPPILQGQQSPGKGFYAGAMFESHPTTSAGLPTPPAHWTLASTPTLQRSQSQPSTPTIKSMQSTLTTPGIDLASLFGSLCGNSSTTASPVAKSFQGESVSQAKQSVDSESSDEELTTEKKAVSKKEKITAKTVIASPKEQHGFGIGLRSTCQGAIREPGCLQEMSAQLKCLMKVAA